MLPLDYIKNGKIKCLECGKYFVRPISHVWQKHNLLAIDYKKLHGLDLKKGITTEEYRDRMRAHVVGNGTIGNLKKGSAYHFQKGKSNNYKRSEQTMERLKGHFERVANREGRSATVTKITIVCARPECGKEKQIYPRALKEGKNFCGTYCRNITNNLNRKSCTSNS